ncbi:MAG TPA: hypothetical protein VFC73_09755 [Syntrophomonadaceae bacterium]|nr:hypothetical protein [Syntrophomonadaceae bacterium]
MEIRNVVANIPAIYNNQQEADKSKYNQEKTVVKDEFIKSEGLAKPITYQKPNQVDRATIQKLQEDSEMAFNQLKEIVSQLLERQGLTFREINLMEVDEQARLEASALVAEGGELSPEKVSDRIVEFAKALSGGDMGKFESLKGAIEKGFEEATRILGGELPEVSQRTYELVMEKLEAWVNE